MAQSSVRVFFPFAYDYGLGGVLLQFYYIEAMGMVINTKEEILKTIGEKCGDFMCPRNSHKPLLVLDSSSKTFTLMDVSRQEPEYTMLDNDMYNGKRGGSFEPPCRYVLEQFADLYGPVPEDNKTRIYDKHLNPICINIFKDIKFINFVNKKYFEKFIEKYADIEYAASDSKERPIISYHCPDWKPKCPK